MLAYQSMQKSVDRMEFLDSPIKVERDSSKSVLNKRKNNNVPYLLPEAGLSQFRSTHTNFLNSLD
jgi:hypothetical protein